jgi:hypothetical protein
LDFCVIDPGSIGRSQVFNKQFTIDDFKKLKAEADAQIEIVDGYVVEDEE